MYHLLLWDCGVLLQVPWVKPAIPPMSFCSSPAFGTSAQKDNCAAGPLDSCHGRQQPALLISDNPVPLTGFVCHAPDCNSALLSVVLYRSSSRSITVCIAGCVGRKKQTARDELSSLTHPGPPVCGRIQLKSKLPSTHSSAKLLPLLQSPALDLHWLDTLAFSGVS